MFFKRKVYEQLLDWKNNHAPHYAALLEGPRRVGKSTIAEEFAKREFKSYIKIDFDHITPEVLACFDSINDTNLFYLRLQSITHTHLIEGQSAIIFDEIQLMPKVRQAMKYLVKDGRYCFIETGSLISINKNIAGIVIPSEEIRIEVAPMDYEEFCWATGIENYENIKAILDCGKPLGQAVNIGLMRNFRIYMAVGGMPQAVDVFIKTNDILKADFVKKQILEVYKDDFKRISPSGKLGMLFSSIPSQLCLKRFSFRKATKRKKRDSDDDLLFDLLDSKTCNICYNITDPGPALSQTIDYSSFKLYLCDVGLMVTMLFNDKGEIGKGIYDKLLSDKLDANLGFLYENAIAQALVSSHRKLYFYTWYEDGKSHPYEIDFLTTNNKGKLWPFEVKSSNVGKHKSISRFMEKFSSKIDKAVLTSQSDLGHDGMLLYYPIYLIPALLQKDIQ